MGSATHSIVACEGSFATAQVALTDRACALTVKGIYDPTHDWMEWMAPNANIATRQHFLFSSFHDEFIFRVWHILLLCRRACRYGL